MKKSFGIFLQLCFLLVVFNEMGRSQGVVLVGSGSTVPAPLVSKWADAYNQRKSGIQMRYIPSGTSEGINAISHGSGDFAAGEVALTTKQRSEAGLVEVPAILIGIVPIYNLPGSEKELRFSGEVLADIFLGNIKDWDAPALVKLNPGIDLPDLRINVVNRPAGKGANYIFTEFLSKTSPKFKTEIGISPSPKWPVGSPAERSSDMADKVRAELGSIGYVEAEYAIKSGIPFGRVLNPAGHYVKASPETITNACQAVEAPDFDKFSASLTNAPGADSFPITSFNWLYLREESSDIKRVAALQDFLGWVFSDGQRIAVEQGYSQLPGPLLTKINAKIKNLR